MADTCPGARLWLTPTMVTGVESANPATPVSSIAVMRTRYCLPRCTHTTLSDLPGLGSDTAACSAAAKAKLQNQSYTQYMPHCAAVCGQALALLCNLLAICK